MSTIRTAPGLILGTLALAVGLTADATIPRPEHPTPDNRRDDWVNLNGAWDFRFDDDDRGLTEQWWKSASAFDSKIFVPFCWESPLSTAFDSVSARSVGPKFYSFASGRSPKGDDVEHKIGWYRRQVTVPASFSGKRVFLRFGAVDWLANVWVNGRPAGQHEGGYTPFEFDITGMVDAGKPAQIVVRALDGTNSELPTGKQAHWYTPTSGIWQTVYLEARPAAHIDRFFLVPVNEEGAWYLDIVASVAGNAAGKFRATSPDPTVERKEMTVSGGRISTRLRVSSPKPWTPETPHLYDLTLRFETADGGVDTVHTYFGLRTISRGPVNGSAHEYILLNGKPVFLRGALDQSFNPEGVYTAPSDEFLRREMELAKSLGFNFLRIHLKVEEPRRLYWADRMGVLIMEDMPNTYRDTPHGRKAWESVMRATVERDRNHPAVFSWCLFNETWGLGGLRARPDTQKWVLSLFEEVKRTDPTRLVDENSANKMDHLKTDINSFHFYMDNPPLARAWIDWVARQTFPGSPFNYVSGYRQDTAPLINAEYSSFGSSGGDRDVSWGFRYLTTQLRRHGKMQGYAYTELTDIEWEHNGLANYNRTVKESGYDAYVPGMDYRDLQGADFVGFDAPPAIEAQPGGEIRVPVFVSHYSDLNSTPQLRWWVLGTDDLGNSIKTDAVVRDVVWKQYGVVNQEPIRVQIPGKRPFLGAVAMELLCGGKRIAANYVNVLARPPAGKSPRVEVLDTHRVAIRFRPDEFRSFEWGNSTYIRTALFPGKFHAPGAGKVGFQIGLPDFVLEAGPVRLELIAELASKALNEKRDWGPKPLERTDPSYPQSDGKKHRGVAHIRLAGVHMEPFELPDDPADARGVLSSMAGTQHASYGYLMRRTLNLAAGSAAQIRDGQIEVQLEVPDSPSPAGLAIYGERMGRYLIDPTLIVHTSNAVGQPAGWTSPESVAVVDPAVR